MMNNRTYPFIALLTAIAVSCSIQEKDQMEESAQVFYAQIEAPFGSGQTKVYADEDLSVLWHADDRVSIFDKNTYNQEYRFTGKTGANAGTFEMVANSGFVTGNALNNVFSVYPYKESTEISNQGVISVDLPATQSYSQNSFGLEANTMVSVSSDNVLMFKNVGGYLRLSLYGKGVSVSSITLKGNNGEKLAGQATISIPQDGIPSISMTKDASTAVTLICDSPVTLGATVEESVDFWFVVPPVVFSKGFQVTIFGNGGVYEKSTENSITVTRNSLSKMSPIEIPISQPNNVIYYTSSNGMTIRPDFLLADDKTLFGARIVSNKYVDGVGILTFDGDVTSIGPNAFYGNEWITSIIIPESVKRIGYHAFFACSSLTSITLPERVSDVEEAAFAGCKIQSFYGKYASADGLLLVYNGTIIAMAAGSLADSVTIPEGVTSIGEAAFSGCTNLTRIIVPEGVKSIGGIAFAGCSNLASITIPNSVTGIYDAAFSGCASLSSIALPNSVTIIRESTFSGCSGLTNISIPNSVENIGYRAFFECTSLTSINIPNNVKIIGSQAFAGCSNLASITIPNSVVSIGDSPLKDCPSLQMISGKYASADGLFLVYNGTIIAMAAGSLKDSVTIPQGVRSIGESAFRGCTGITNINIPEGVTSIGELAFTDCTDLASITIPNSMASIGRYAFCRCRSLTSVTIPNSVRSINDGTFSECTSLRSVIIPESVTGIAEKAFYECASLTNVIIPESVTSIGMQSFCGCSSLTSITIPGSVKSIGYFAFSECSNLTRVIISEGVTDIMGATFSFCTSLTSITIPNSVTRIGSQSFEQCTSLTSVTIPENVTSIGGSLFFKCTSLASVTIPESVTNIGTGAFYGCSSLTKITLPDSVISIGRSAFDSCSSLKSITIPKSVTSIGNYGFYGCSSLTSITVLPETPPQGGIEMLYDTNDAPIYVPSVGVADYKLAQYWSDYANRIQAISQ